MVKRQNKNIQISLIIFLIIGAAFASNFIFVAGQTDVECTTNEMCGAGRMCVNWKCRETCIDCGGVDSSSQNNQGINNYQSSTDYTPIIVTIIIAVAIITGFIILAIILSRRKKR